MKTDKKPDNVVYNPETETYDAALKPYSTSVGAPVITTTDNISWKNRSISKINHKVEAKYLELQAEYQKMIFKKTVITACSRAQHLLSGE